MPVIVEYVPDADAQHTVYQVPLVHFYEDNTVLVIHKKGFIRVAIKEVRFARWSN